MMLNEIAEDQSGKTPLHYMTVATKLSSIKRFNSVEKGSDSVIDGEGVSTVLIIYNLTDYVYNSVQTLVKIDLEYDEICKCVKVPPRISKKELLRRSYAEFGKHFDSLNVCNDAIKKVERISPGERGESYLIEDGAKFELDETKVKQRIVIC